MRTTTATTGSPPQTEPAGLVLDQIITRPTMQRAVRQRLRDLLAQGERRITPGQFEDIADSLGRPASWITDHLLVLQGLGVLRPALHCDGRSWTVAPDAEYLQ